MTTTAWVTMVLICGLVWGGFGLLLTRALRSEGRKISDGEGRSAADGNPRD